MRPNRALEPTERSLQLFVVQAIEIRCVVVGMVRGRRFARALGIEFGIGQLLSHGFPVRKQFPR
jgi:hypothetical protein